MDEIWDIELKNHQLRPTKIRKVILRMFCEQESALSQKYIEESLQSSFDRVTIYRTLKSFTEKGIIHSIRDGERMIKYAISKEKNATFAFHLW